MLNKLKSYSKTAGFVALGTVVISGRLAVKLTSKAKQVGEEYYQSQKEEVLSEERKTYTVGEVVSS